MDEATIVTRAGGRVRPSPDQARDPRGAHRADWPPHSTAGV